MKTTIAKTQVPQLPQEKPDPRLYGAFRYNLLATKPVALLNRHASFDVSSPTRVLAKRNSLPPKTPPRHHPSISHCDQNTKKAEDA